MSRRVVDRVVAVGVGSSAVWMAADPSLRLGLALIVVALLSAVTLWVRREEQW